MITALNQNRKVREERAKQASKQHARDHAKASRMREREGGTPTLDNLEDVGEIEDGGELDTERSDKDEKLARAARKHEKVTHHSTPNAQSELERKPYFINPLDHRKTAWDLYMGLLIVLSVIEVPWRIALNVQAEGGWDAWAWWIDIMFTMDIIANFRTGYVDADGLVVWDAKKIRYKYLTGWFTIDILSTIPFDKFVPLFLIGSGQEGDASSVARSGKLLRIFRVVRLLKLTRLLKMAKLFSQGDGNELMGQSTVDLIKMIVQVTFAGHFLACVYLMVADDTEDPTMDTWLKDSGVSKFEDPWLKYMVSMYWSFTTMTTVGYGDVNPSPRNVPEHVFVMVAMIIGTSIFGYFVGNITVIFESFDVQASITKEKLERVRDYCRDKEIPEGIKRRLQRHYKYFYGKRGCFDTDTMFDRFDSTLRDDIVLEQENNVAIMKQFPRVFSERDRGCHAKILENLLPAFVYEAEEMYVEGEHGTELYFLKKGEIRLFCDDPNHPDNSDGFLRTRFTVPLLHMKKGEVFGMASLINDVPHTATAIAEEYSEIYFLKKLVLVEIFYEWPSLLRRFHSLAKSRSTKVNDIKRTRDIPIDHKASPRGVLRTNSMVETATTSTKQAESEDGPGLELAAIGGSAASPAPVRSPSQRRESRSMSVSAAQKHKDLWETKRVIHPENTKKVLWDIFQGVLIVYSVITVPYRMAFLVPTNVGWDVSNTIIDILFGVDIILNFFTAYFDDEGKLISERWPVIRSYLRSWFFIDFFATFPIDAVITAANQGEGGGTNGSARLLKILRLFRLFKLFRLLKLGSFFGKYEEMITINPAIIKLLKLFTGMWFVAHLEGCLFFAITDKSDSDAAGWAKTYFCEGLKWHDAETRANSTLYNAKNDMWLCFDSVDLETRYWAAVYWAFTTMTTVGYGDITPEISIFSEMITTVIVQLLGTIVFAYVIGGVMNLVINFDPAARMTKQETQLLDGYMGHVKYSKIRQRRLRKSFNHYLEFKSIFRESDILDSAPNYIVRDVYNHLCEKTLAKVRILKQLDNDNEGFLAFVFPYLIPSLIPAGQYVWRKNCIGRAMYFVIRGEASLEFSEQDDGIGPGTQTSTFGAGDCFGQSNLLVPLSIPFSHKRSMKANKVLSLIMLKRNSLFLLRELSNRSVDMMLACVSIEVDLPYWVNTAEHYKPRIKDAVERIQNVAHLGGEGAIHKQILKRGTTIMTAEEAEQIHDFSTGDAEDITPRNHHHEKETI
jgi:CRP-like cAMP-binding protein